MKVAIIGTGGVGGYFGGKIALAGYPVTFLARGEHLKAIRNKGLMIKSIQGDFFVEKVNATDTIKDIGHVDLIILGIKAWQIKEVASELHAIANKNTTILPLQNGVLAAEELKDQGFEQNVLGGLCRIISKIEAPGVINHFGVEPLIIFGELDNFKSARVQKIKEFFNTSGIQSRIAEDIHSELWKKFISICASGLLAVTHSTYGEIRELEETRQLLIELLKEIFEISKKAGIKIESDFIEKTVAYIGSFPYNSTSSLARDVWEGKPSEIEYQNGTVVRLGEKYGVATPINRYIYNCILPMEKRARKNK